MKRLFLLLFTLLIFMSCKNKSKSLNQSPIDYPNTKAVDSTTNYFGEVVNDPYRWLEDDRSEATEQWVKSQNTVTFTYLDNIPYREELKERLTKIWNYEKIGAPFVEGNYTYFRKNDGLQNQFVIYRYKNGEDPKNAEVFIDPNTFKEDGTISLGGLSFSEDGSKAAYSISEGGSDWRKILVMNAETKDISKDTIVDVKFSGMSWYKNEGFFYSSYDKPEGSELSAKTDQHKLYYHKLGTKQSEDKLVFGGIPEEKHRYVYGYVTEDNKYLSISAKVSTSGNKLYVKDLSEPNSKLVEILGHTDSDTYILHSDGEMLFLVTNLNAPNKKIVKVKASNPSPENWTDLIAETNQVLSPSVGGGYIFAEYMEDAVSKVLQYDFTGNLIGEIELPGLGSVGGFNGKEDDKELYYSFTNYVTPGTIYKFNVKERTSQLYKKPEIDFNPEDYISKQVFYTSK
ncbi:MAG: S9 family peptidase, partial [Winogradskyella sp.]|nr:S9 family peptidase [Winogradskyella sp.]